MLGGRLTLPENQVGALRWKVVPKGQESFKQSYQMTTFKGRDLEYTYPIQFGGTGRGGPADNLGLGY